MCQREKDEHRGTSTKHRYLLLCRANAVALNSSKNVPVPNKASSMKTHPNRSCRVTCHLPTPSPNGGEKSIPKEPYSCNLVGSKAPTGTILTTKGEMAAAADCTVKESIHRAWLHQVPVPKRRHRIPKTPKIQQHHLCRNYHRRRVQKQCHRMA